jgi:hypothetical protein
MPLKNIFFTFNTLVFVLFSQNALAQQNLFNVLSADITEENHIFFQQQFNIGFFSGSSNTTLDYGLSNQLEIGINLFNVDIQATNGAFQNSYVLFNFQKGFELTDNYKIGFGTESGFTPLTHKNTINLPSFSYIDSALDLEQWHLGKYYLGCYYANHAYNGSGDNFGVMAGIDYPIIKDKFDLMADILTGNSDISVAVLGMVFYLPHEWQLSLGAQLPAPSSHNEYGLVLGITKLFNND